MHFGRLLRGALCHFVDFFVVADALGHVDLLKSEAVEEGGDGGAGVFAGGVEDTVGEGGMLELLLGFGAGVGLEVLVGGDEDSGGAERRRGCAGCRAR